MKALKYESTFENDRDYATIEVFPTISSLLYTMDNREHNTYMRGEDSSETGSTDFTGTKSWEESINLMRNGWDKYVQEIKQKSNKGVKGGDKYAFVKKAKPYNSIVGFLPNVPNAILNIPESMITKDFVPQKRKTLNIEYFMSGSCGESQEFFKNAGIALVTAINIIEKANVQVKLNVYCFSGQVNGSGNKTHSTFCGVTIKNYGERFDLQKICFPLIHPSFLRRIGFKYLETTPLIKDNNWSWGYGKPIYDVEELKRVIKPEKNVYILSTGWIKNHNNNVEEILKYLGFKTTIK